MHKLQTTIKKILITIAFIVCTVGSQAQGVIQFSATLTGADEVPPNTDPTVATGARDKSGG
jgi:hypothetical protein